MFKILEISAVSPRQISAVYWTICNWN